jgi:hypothetical protein
VGRVDCSNLGARKANSDETKHPESHLALNIGILGVIGSKHTDYNRQCLFGKALCQVSTPLFCTARLGRH